MSPQRQDTPESLLGSTLERRFGGVARVYGNAALRRFLDAHVCVIGVGGVGSWAVEALARSGVGRLTLIDADHVTESNINRQLPALDDTIGREKIRVLAQRVAAIHPACTVHPVDEMVTVDNTEELLPAGFDYVIDCSDNAKVKAEIADHCRRSHIRLLITGGAGGKTDPTRVRISDLSRSHQDPLLAKLRKRLRSHYGYTRNPRRQFALPCVWSDESPVLPSAAAGLNCAGGIGSVMTVTAAFGLAAASRALDSLSG